MRQWYRAKIKLVDLEQQPPTEERNEALSNKCPPKVKSKSQVFLNRQKILEEISSG